MSDWQIAPNGSEGYSVEIVYRCPKRGFTEPLKGMVCNGDIEWWIQGIQITHCPWCGNELFALFDDLLTLVAEREKFERWERTTIGQI